MELEGRPSAESAGDLKSELKSGDSVVGEQESKRTIRRSCLTVARTHLMPRFHTDSVSSLPGCVITPASFHWLKHRVVITKGILASAY